MEITHRYTKTRREFGRPVYFSDAASAMLADIRPNEDYIKQYVAQRQINSMIQVMPEVSEHEVQTNPVSHANKSVNHVEGGWPRDIDHTDAEQTIRFRKKVEKDAAYIKAVEAAGAAVERIINTNNAIDIYEDFFSHRHNIFAARRPHLGMTEEEATSEAAHAKTVAILRGPTSCSRNAALHLSWHPDGARKLAVAHCTTEFQSLGEGPCSSWVWDMANPNSPVHELKAGSSLMCLNYNLKDSNVIGSGQYNGQISVFDTRRGSTPVDSSLIEYSHRDPVYDLAWLQSKTGTECMSAASDGSVLWWDTRKLAEPVESLIVTERGSDKVLGAVSLDYSPQAGPTKFVLGTEQGLIVSGNRKAKTPADRIGTVYSGHHSAVYSVVRNPSFPKYLLSVGDWTTRVWNEDLKAPIITSKYSRTYLKAARWSPTRPGVFYVAKSDGYVEAWDYLYKQSEPILSIHISEGPLSSLRLQDNGQTLAVGASDGCVTVLKLSEALHQIQPNEKRIISAMLERETAREKNLEKAAKEAKQKARKEAGRAGDTEKVLTEEELERIEREFLEATKV